MFGQILGGIASAVVPMLFGSNSSAGQSSEFVGPPRRGGGRNRQPQGIRDIYDQRGLFGVLGTPESRGGLSGAYGNMVAGLAAPNPNAYLRLDPRQRQQFSQSLGEADRYATSAMGSLGAMSDDRASQMDANIGQQLSAVQGVFGQEGQDIDAQYDALAAARNNQVSESGFGNTTAVPGVRAMVERERGAAQRRNTAAQASMLGNIYGQRARSLDDIAMQRQGTAQGFLSQGMNTRSGLAQGLSQATSYQRPGLLGRLFS